MKFLLKSTITFSLLFWLSLQNTYAGLHYTQNQSTIQFYTKINQEALLIIPLKNYDFIELSQRNYSIKEKLGSYKPKFKIKQVAEQLQLLNIDQVKSTEIILNYQYEFNNQIESLIIRFKESNNELVLYIDSLSNPEINHISFNFIEKTKAIFGGGIQFSHCNLKGKSFPLIVEENGVGRGDKKITFWAKLLGAAGNEFTTYAPVPIFITNNQTKYKLKSSGNHFWEINFENDYLLNYSFNHLEKKGIKNIEISISKKPILENVSAENTAKRHSIKDWMFGYIFGVQGGKGRVDSLINLFKENDINISAIWIQDWVGKQKTPIGSRLQWNWKANEAYYPNIENWIDSLHNQNIKVLGYINPYFVENKSQANEGIEHDYFVRNPNNEPYLFEAGGFKAYMIDLSNNEAREWTKSIIKTEMIDIGFDGWMCDFGEWLPFECNTENDSELNHNNYPVEWVKLNWEIINEENKEEELFVFNRSAYLGTLDVPVNMWLGDQMSNFGKNDGLASAINAYNSASLSGFPLIHSDIGGYTAIKMGPLKFLRSEELLKRWIEMETFTPFFRSHEGLKPDHMLQIYSNKEMLQFFKKFNTIHQDLIPYFKKVNDELLTNGTPMVRHPFLLYPDDENTLNMQYQFFVGDRLLVCPVYEAETKMLNIYLPKVKWSHYFTKEIFDGEKHHKIVTPIGQPAVFWRLD